MTKELASLDATAQAELIASGEASPGELVEAAVERIEELNPQVNAVIHEFFEDGLAAAAGDLPDGPFKGVPFLLKDLGPSFAGQPFHLGTKLLKDIDFRCPVDTYVALRFRQAGFVTIGKTNLPELGILPTTEPDAYGATRNPWSLEHSTGGSSGGAAAAVASGMVPVAHANDGGGSIRIPASECGLVGLKTTRQRTTEGPLVGDSLSGLTGDFVVSKSMRDTAAILDAIHGPAPGDPYVAPPPSRPYVSELNADPKGLRIAATTETLIGEESHPDCVAALVAATRLVESLGHSTDTPDLSPFAGLDLPGTFSKRWFAGQAALIEQLSGIVGRPVTADDVEPLTWAMVEEGRKVTGPEYLGAVGIHQATGRMFAALYESGFDILMTPTIGEPPPPLGTFDDSGPNPLDAFRRAFITGTFTAPFNATGQPAMSLPLYWNEAGLPIGIQFVAPLGREDLLIALGAQLERAQPWADRRPPVFAGAAAATHTS